MYLVTVKVIIRLFDIVGYKDVISMIILTFDLIWKSKVWSFMSNFIFLAPPWVIPYILTPGSPP